MSGLRLNMGSAMHPAPGPWINVEAIWRDTHPKPDILLSDYDYSLTDAIADVYGEDATVSAIYAGHTLEHIDQHIIVGVISEWFDLLEPGGELGVCQPDVNIALQYYKDGLIPLRDLHRHMEVGDVWPAERWETFYRDGQLDSFALHSWNSVPERVHGLLRAIGFIVEEREPTREGMAGWPLTGFGGAQLACVGTKPS